MVEVNERIKSEFLNALCNSQMGNNEAMKRFALMYPDTYKVVVAMHHKRNDIRQNIKCMKEVSNCDIVFGAYTFNEEEDKKDIATKRKQVVRNLTKHFDMFLFVEELGTEKERYHIHFLGVLKPNITYNEVRESWHSRFQIEKVISTRKTVNYLTNYLVKQVPRIRRNKKLIECFNHWKKSRSWTNYGFKGYATEEMNSAIISLVFDL